LTTYSPHRDEEKEHRREAHVHDHAGGSVAGSGPPEGLV
jgi:hypothetical protein